MRHGTVLVSSAGVDLTQFNNINISFFLDNCPEITRHLGINAKAIKSKKIVSGCLQVT